MKFDQNLVFDDRKFTTIAQLSVSGEDVFNTDISLNFDPRDANKVYEINAMVNVIRLK